MLKLRVQFALDQVHVRAPVQGRLLDAVIDPIGQFGRRQSGTCLAQRREQGEFDDGQRYRFRQRDHHPGLAIDP